MRKFVLYLTNRLPCILALYTWSLLMSSLLFSMFEGKTLFESLWWSVVTSLTVGYGDFAPVTYEGRIMAMLFMHFWVFLIIPMIVANLIMRSIENMDNFTHEEQEWQEQMLLNIAKKTGAEIMPCPKRDH